MKEAVWRAVRRAQFEPTAIARFVNPYYLARSELHRGISETAPELNGTLLDVGCGSAPYRGLFTGVDRYIGLDIGRARGERRSVADVYYSDGSVPFRDCSFDSVFCSQVLEHVFEPSAFLRETHRVLRPGGLLLLTTPFVWDEHEQPWDFGRYSSYGLHYLVESCGFRIRVQKRLTPGAAAVLQLLTASMTQAAQRALGKRVGLVVAGGGFVPINLTSALWLRASRRNATLYLDNLILAEVPPS